MTLLGTHTHNVHGCRETGRNRLNFRTWYFLQSAAEELGPFSCGVEVSTELKFEAVDVRVHGLDSLGWCRLYGLECH